MWDNWCFGLIEDIVGGKVPNIVEFPCNLFQLILNGNVIVITQPYLLQEQFNTLPDQEIDWLCAAYTIIQPGQTISPLSIDQIVPVLGDRQLIEHQMQLIEEELPGQQPGPNLRGGGLQVVNTIDSLVTEQRLARQEMTLFHQELRINTINDFFGPLLPLVLNICQAADSDSLPPIYQDLAQYGKKKVCQTLQKDLDQELL